MEFISQVKLKLESIISSLCKMVVSRCDLKPKIPSTSLPEASVLIHNQHSQSNLSKFYIFMELINLYNFDLENSVMT